MVARITRHAHNLKLLIAVLRVVNRDLSANGIGIAKVKLGHGLINDHYGVGVQGVLRPDIAAQQHGDPQGCKVIWAHTVKCGFQIVIRARNISRHLDAVA